jgi:hypothetical protein
VRVCARVGVGGGEGSLGKHWRLCECEALCERLHYLGGLRSSEW